MKTFLSKLIRITGARSIGLGENEILIFPDGKLVMVDNGEVVEIDGESMAALIKTSADRGVKIPLDYEHSTHHKAAKGEPSPAAGWISSLRYEAGKGLIGVVEWTKEASERIARREYKYLSPHFDVNAKTNKVAFLLAVALTNTPRIKNVAELVAASLAKKERRTMNPPGGGDRASVVLRGDRAKLKKILGSMGIAGVAEDDGKVLSSGATLLANLDELMGHVDAIKQYLIASGAVDDSADAMAVLKAAMAMMEGGTEDAAPSEADSVAASLAEKVGLKSGATAKDVMAAIDGMKVKSVPATEYVALTARIESLEAEKAARRTEELVASAVKLAKLNPNDKEQAAWAENEAKTNPEGFERWMASAPKLWIAGRTSDPATTRKTGTDARREQTIRSALRDYERDEDGRMGASRSAWVNASLRGEGMVSLNETETKELAG